MSAPDLILHHDPAAAACEAVRRALGHKQLPWRSVPTGTAASDQVLEALLGPGGSPPVAQVGADLYVGASLVGDLLEHLQPEPPLYPPHLRGVSRIFAQWADTTLASTVQALRAPGLAAADATSACRSYLRRIASMVEAHDFLFGADACVADFATYAPLWFARARIAGAVDLLAVTPAVGEWMERVEALGTGRPEPLDPPDALTVAARADPAPPGENLLVDSGFQDDHGLSLGRWVRVAGTEGELVAATRTHYTLHREDPQAGHLHVHFPRLGYPLRPA